MGFFWILENSRYVASSWAIQVELVNINNEFSVSSIKQTISGFKNGF